MNKRIMHVITTIELGGAEKQLIAVCEEQVSLGHEVQVVYLKGQPKLLASFQKIRVVVHKLSSDNFLNQIASLRIQVDSFKPDIIHAHLPRAELLCLSIRPLQGFFVSRHNAESFWPKGPKLLSRGLSRFVISRSLACIAISEAVLEFGLQSREFPRTNKIFLVHYGIRYKSNSLLRSKSLTSCKLLCVARLEKQKDIPTLIKSIALLANSNHDLTLQLVGAGSLEIELKSLSDRLGLSGAIFFRGKVDNVENLYDEADFLVLPSLYEGFGLVYLEAISRGLPVITSRNSAAIEIFGEDYPGFFDIGNSDELASIISEFQKYQDNSRFLQLYDSILKKFDSKIMVTELEKIYDDTLSKASL